MGYQMPGSALGFEAVQTSRSGGSSDVFLLLGGREVCEGSLRHRLLTILVYARESYDTTLDLLFRCHRG